MKAQDYYLDCNELGYCVNNAQGTVAVFALIEDAYAAISEFRNKRFPESWQKIPPAMRQAKLKCYGCCD